MSCVSAASSTSTSTVVSISAQELHEILLTTHTAKNLTKRRFIDALRSLSESRLFLELGFPSIVAYADATFRMAKSQTYECLRVSKALASLPEIAAAFESGEITFSLVIELTRVASTSTEAEWLAFLRAQSSVTATLAELRDARTRSRGTPRKGSFGLPGRSVKLKFELTPEDHAVIERGFAKVTDEMAAGLDGARPEPEKVLLYLMDRVLHERPATAAPPSDTSTAPRIQDAKDRAPPSPYTVAFVRCPDCHRAAVETSIGRVEVDPRNLTKLSGSAEVIEIDPDRELPPSIVDTKDDVASVPTTAEVVTSDAVLPEAERSPPNSEKLRRELRARAGHRCENPYCRRDTRGGGHGHHMIARAAGGTTALWNEVHVCERCHGLIHAGSLEITGSRLEGLLWTPRAADSTREVRRELDRARGLPVVRVVESRGCGRAATSAPRSGDPETDTTGRADSGDPDSALTLDPAVADTIAALRNLGFAQTDARRRATSAWRRTRAGGEGGEGGKGDGGEVEAAPSVARLITAALRG